MSTPATVSTPLELATITDGLSELNRNMERRLAALAAETSDFAGVGATSLRKQVKSIIPSVIAGGYHYESKYCKLVQAIAKKERYTPSATAFWSVPCHRDDVLLRYSRLQPIEAIGALHKGCGLHTLDDPNNKTARNGTVDIDTFHLSSFSEETRLFSQRVFYGSPRSINFRLRHRGSLLSGSQAGVHTAEAEFATARYTLRDKFAHIDEACQHLAADCDALHDKLLKFMRDQKKVEALADSDPDGSDSDGSDGSDGSEDDKRPRPRSKRRKRFDEVGTTRDTPQQIFHIDGIAPAPARGVKNMRVRDFIGDEEPHIVDLFGCLYYYGPSVAKRLPHPIAPTFSSGAEFDHRAGRLLPPTGWEKNTIITRKMRNTDPALCTNYETVHRDAAQLRDCIRSVVAEIMQTFEFDVEFECETYSYVHQVAQLTDVQQLAIGQMFLERINKVDKAEEEEKAGSDREDGDDNEDDDEPDEEPVGDDEAEAFDEDVDTESDENDSDYEPDEEPVGDEAEASD